MRKRFSDTGMQVAPSSPEEFGELPERDLAKYETIIQEAGIKAE